MYTKSKVLYKAYKLYFQYSVLLSQLAERAKSTVRDLDPELVDELKYMRIKSKTNELFVAPRDDFILIVLQNLPQIKAECHVKNCFSCVFNKDSAYANSKVSKTTK